MSEIKVNKISPRSGTTVTLGDSGDTFTIPAGATINNQGTATNFGATGSASWVTTVKTGDFTAVAGEGYFVNTTSGEIDVTLPASPSAGAVVALKDYANTWDTNNCILLRNGSNIGGQALNSTLITEGLAVTLVYVDATKGWLVTDSGLQSEAPSPTFITATGGTITTVCTNFKVHTFAGPGTFTVCSVGNAAGSNSVDYMIIGGGGGGGACRGGGGGAGGYRESPGTASGSYTVSPLGVSPAVALPVTATGFPITVGAGGAGSPGRCGADSVNGAVTTFSTITSSGGGGGAKNFPGKGAGTPGASGGGGVRECGAQPGGTGNTPPVSPPQGNPGGSGPGANSDLAGGGGGATVAGAVGNGGAGATSSINGTPTARAGGGGGGPGGGPTGSGADGGGNGGGANPGTANTGGGGGGGATPSAAGNGGSGLVIIRYKFQ